MKILVTGAAGMVGRATVQNALSRGHVVLATIHGALDIADAQAVDRFLDRERPEAVINCAAFIDVDGSESRPEVAFAVNAHGPENLARACAANGGRLVTISTDYVFDGKKEGFYTQNDAVGPQGVYARAKVRGEQLARAACPRTTIVRSGWIFGAQGKNFLSQVLDKARRGEPLKAIHDAYGTPTYGPDLAQRLVDFAERGLAGIYHVVNAGGGTSYAGFTQAALQAAGLSAQSVELVAQGSLERPAPRPRNSRLACVASDKAGLSPLPHWTVALARFAKLP
ncbi:MAG: dTDP-4-dehydrorhamnose reductase [Deltaproteobacteria bacterium]|nr:dTDP-4-dehydrorhamnose reductase [Deltaproteobacteria bacterium]